MSDWMFIHYICTFIWFCFVILSSKRSRIPPCLGEACSAQDRSKRVVSGCSGTTQLDLLRSAHLSGFMIWLTQGDWIGFSCAWVFSTCGTHRIHPHRIIIVPRFLMLWPLALQIYHLQSFPPLLTYIAMSDIISHWLALKASVLYRNEHKVFPSFLFWYKRGTDPIRATQIWNKAHPSVVWDRLHSG